MMLRFYLVSPFQFIKQAMMNKKPPFSFLGLVAVAAAAAIVLPACSESRTAGDEQKQQAQQQRPAPMVGVVMVHAGPVVTQVDLPGRLAAHRVADVRPQVGGIIKKRLFEEGSQVKARQANGSDRKSVV